MSKPRAIPLAAQVEAAVERAEKAEGQVAALDYGIKAAHAQCATLKAELTALNRAQRAAKARIKELEMNGVHDFEPPKTAPPPYGMLYGDPASERLMTLFKLEADAACMARAAAKAAEAELGRVRADLRWEKTMRNAAESYADRLAGELSMAKSAQTRAALLKPGTVVTVPSQSRFCTFGEAVCLFAGLGLGVIAGGMLL